MSRVTLPEVERLVEKMDPADQLLLMERIAQQLRLALPREPQDLYGIAKGKFPEDFDVDAAIHEIRTAWKRDLDDITGPAGDNA